MGGLLQWGGMGHERTGKKKNGTNWSKKLGERYLHRSKEKAGSGFSRDSSIYHQEKVVNPRISNEKRLRQKVGTGNLIPV